MDDSPIYTFEGLKALLRSRGFHIKVATAWEPITGQDVGVDAFTSGQLKFDVDGGITLVDDDGNEHLGFLYKREYLLLQHGKPRMHLCRCSTLENFIASGSFETLYRYAETDKVMVIDQDNWEKDTEVSDLPLCKNCIKLLQANSPFKNIRLSSDFANLVDKVNFFTTSQAKKEKDIFGFSKDWDTISEEFKEKCDYTCNNCGLKIENPFHHHYLQVFHINHKKADNKFNNLRCLCPECLALYDAEYEDQIKKGAAKVVYDQFRVDYP